MKKILLLAFTLIMLCSTFSLNSYAETTAYNFYCKRNSEHKQPLLDSNMKFIESYNGYYVDRNYGDNNTEKVIYLTFDAGYENGNIEKVLNVLKEQDVKAAFFILSNMADKNSELLIRMVEEGHTVCNHTSKHPDMTKCDSIDDFSAELSALEKIYKEKTGNEISKYYRPPCGRFSEDNLKYANELGYKTIFWSFAYADWDNSKQMSASEAEEKILSNIHNGEIMLLHPTSSTNASILEHVIVTLKSEGYRFGTLDELTGNSNG